MFISCAELNFFGCVIIVVADGIRKDMETYNEAILGFVFLLANTI